MARAKKEKETVEKKEPAKNDLFDLIKAIFMDDVTFSQFGDLTIKRNSFMVNRIMSIAYPLQAQMFNTTSINDVDMVKFWHQFLGGQRYTPRWIYTKGSKKASEESMSAKSIITPTLIHKYCLANGQSFKDVSNAVKLFPQECEQIFTEFVKYLEETGKK